MKALLFAVAVLQGCAGYNMASMSPEQLEALAKNKNAAVYCASWQGGRVLYVNDDKGVITRGGIVVSETCGVSISHNTAQQDMAVPRAGIAAPTNVVVPFTATPVQVQ